MNPILQLKNLSVGYREGKDDYKVLGALNAQVMPGELIGIIGQNGIGKSTLLRTLARLQKPIHGEVFIQGKNLLDYRRSDFSKLISFVSTDIVRLNHCTVRELVAFGRSPYTSWFGKTDARDEEMIDEAIEMVGLSALSQRNINQISDGERQRVMIARTLAQDTDIIILDEPTAFLDLPNKFEVVHLLGELTRKKGKTIIFSSHDLTIAMKEADMLWIVLPDQLVDGAPEDLVLQHKISHIFQKTKLKFDPKKGEFSIGRKSVGMCRLTGKGTSYIWTKKALERLGYESDAEIKDEDFQIHVNESGDAVKWEFTDKQRNLIFTSVYDLVAFLKNNSTE